MRTFLTLWRRELAGCFLSPIAYVVTIFFLAVLGYIFWFLASVLADGPGGVTVLHLFFASPFFWMVLLVVVPVLTMRLVAEEKRSGTMETLLCAPVTDAQVVLAKYAGVLSFYVAMWIPTLCYVFVLRRFSAVMAPPDLQALATGYAGVLLVGAFYLSMGLFSSALTSNQIIAAILCFALTSLTFFAGFLETLGHSEGVRRIGAYVSSYTHVYDFSRGVLDSRPVVFYLTGTAFFLFAAIKVVGARRWK